MNKKNLKILLIIVLTQFFCLTAESQLKVSLNVSSRPDPYLSNWEQRKEIVIVTIINSGKNSVKAKFDCKINIDGKLILNTKPELMKELDVPTGLSQYYGEDLVPYDAAKIQGGADKTALQTGMLPAGFYEFCVSLLDVSNRQITAPICKSFSIQSYQAPMLLQPQDRAGLKKGERPMFRWTPVSPRPQFLVTYTLQVFEVLAGQTPINAFRVNQPIIDQSGITGTQFLWPADVELPNPNLQHIWTVRAIDEKGNSVGEPDGYATPFTFADCCHYPIGCCPPEDKVMNNSQNIASIIVDEPNGTEKLIAPIGGACASLKAQFIHNNQPKSYIVKVKNNYTIDSSKVGGYHKPMKFKLIIEGDSIVLLKDKPKSSGPRPYPPVISGRVKSISWSNDNDEFPKGNIDLGEVVLASTAVKKIKVKFEWFDERDSLLCRDSADINEVDIYYHMNEQYPNEYIEVTESMLNVQFVNNYTSTGNFSIQIKNTDTREEIRGKSSSMSLPSINGLNRITIPLESFNIIKGNLYTLEITNSKNTFYLNFKVTNDAKK